MAEPVNIVLFACSMALLLWGALYDEGRRLATTALVGATAALIAWWISGDRETTGGALALGALLGAWFPGWNGRGDRWSRALLGGGWKPGGMGAAGGSATRRW